MGAKRWKFEAGILACTTAHLIIKAGYKRASGSASQGACSNDIILAALTFLAIFIEAVLGSSSKKWHGYKTKPADSEGLALGSLALPWVFRALSSSFGHIGQFDVLFKASTSMVACMVLYLTLKGPKRSIGGGLKRGLKPRVNLRKGEHTIILASFTFIEILVLYSFFENGLPHSLVTFSVIFCAIVSLLGYLCLNTILWWLPGCFTIGEALVTTVATTLLIVDSGQILLTLQFQAKSVESGVHVFEHAPNLLSFIGERSFPAVFTELLVCGTLIFAIIFCNAARWHESRDQKTKDGYSPSERLKGSGSVKSVKQKSEDTQSAFSRGQILILGTLAICGVLMLVKPASLVLQYVFGDTARVKLLVYWSLVLGTGLPIMDWLSRGTKFQTILIRKGYHVLALVLFAPALVLQPVMLVISLAIACALMIIIEALRVSNFPIIAPRVHAFMTSFIDERDSGLLLVSHFSLLIGMAAPVWLLGGSSLKLEAHALFGAFSGIIILGIADSAASGLGRRYGRNKILGTKKSAEGTLGGIVCNILAWCCLRPLAENMSITRIIYASVASCLLEASTTQLDNVFLPLHHLTFML